MGLPFISDVNVGNVKSVLHRMFLIRFIPCHWRRKHVEMLHVEIKLQHYKVSSHELQRYKVIFKVC